ncbi:maleylacetoacetate isomerase [Legionella micdadei]|uniref:Maleylacetoacetate isomerase n=1 Tax=Legionella micdadei TaxID=451 RepID=A0A098GIX7_LEGMI|nr:maleylacetoacetate isomerase [Legionella micdadei]ARG97115.1 maleylacetoacetate isomerase [Legionella micdadei]ARH00627.1 maleylacetoacetate isomerase [Legionella micdadei]KTD29290.1 glutathione S-transferase (maleylacetoacetate isomerase) [Legionella micdadei]NSL17337.1 maleylacetoacetate isomerase [Legionella micdadei]CEG61446.1 putative maleylacetoacetate isomerase [Legionella micdadei]
MKLYDYYRSSASYRVRIALNVKNISYETLAVHLINHGGEQYHPDYLQLNPQGLVPTLNENGHIITQSIAIIEYLEEICPTPHLLPQTPLARAQVRSMALTIACDVHPLNNLRVLERLRGEFNADEQQILGWYHHWLKLGFDALENRLEAMPHKNKVCYGNEVSMADVCLIPQVYNAHRFNFSMENYPLINEIYAYCCSLEPFKAAAPESNMKD